MFESSQWNQSKEALKKKEVYPSILFHFLHPLPRHCCHWLTSAQCSHKIRIRLRCTLIATDASCTTGHFEWPTRNSIHSIPWFLIESTIAFMVVPHFSLSPLPSQLVMLFVTISQAKKILSTFNDFSVEGN